MRDACLLCSRTTDHEPWCAHFMRGPDAGGDPHEWPTLLDMGAELLAENAARVAAASAPAETLQHVCERLSAELGVGLTLGYIGNCGPHPYSRDDRSWSVDFDSEVWRGDTAGRGPWSHRADGWSRPATPSWSTAEAPTPAELERMIRTRLEREQLADSVMCSRVGRRVRNLAAIYRRRDAGANTGRNAAGTDRTIAESWSSLQELLTAGGFEQLDKQPSLAAAYARLERRHLLGEFAS